jgi:hypothetical protein
LDPEWAIGTTIMLLIEAEGGARVTNKGCAVDKAISYSKIAVGRLLH